jgi:hypothetical protein
VKPTKRLITIVLIIFAYLITYGQHPTSIKKAECIFEGTIIKQTYKPKTTLTCSVFQIKKIFKENDNIKLGTIKVESEQSTPYMKIEDGGPGLKMGSTYIIFGVLTDANTFLSVSTDNLSTLRCIDNIAFVGGGAKWGWHNPTQFKTVDSLYSFFKENGLTVQEEVEGK